MQAHHLLPLPVSAQPAGRVFGPLPLPQSGLGLSPQRPLQWFQPLKGDFERTPIGVFPPMMEGHDKPFGRGYLMVASPRPYYVARV
ncbi:hypothetical protein B6U96_19355 [Archaeoglobales archaeon ex4484_92]|nr:MAG: hypothetical protein B6U96_19355 [Archaeoglobales archaeon ex4484_92]